MLWSTMMEHFYLRFIKVHWRHIAIVRVKTFLVVIPNVRSHILINLFTRRLTHCQNPMVLYATEEPLHNGISPASPHITPTSTKGITLEDFTIKITRVWWSKTTMTHQPLGGCLRLYAPTSALLIKAVAIYLSICGPIIRREYRSITITYGH